VLGVTRTTKVYAYGAPVDMRKSFDTLSALVMCAMKHDLLSGELFLFVGKNRKRAKVLYFDGTGLCLFSKRLEKGRFTALWRESSGALELTSSELMLFLEGTKLEGRLPLSPPQFRLGEQM
jgi:transposase